MMKRIILHWTAGADGLNNAERDSYHFIISRDGKVWQGLDRIADNIPPLKQGKYAAHTLNCNSYSIGVALDAMGGANENPFIVGKYPITDVQLQAMAEEVARLCARYDIPVTRGTVLTHAEVERTLGIKQKAKWDITWLPGMVKPGDAILVGDRLRAMVTVELDKLYGGDVVPKPKAAPAPTLNFFQRWWAAITGV